MGSDLPIKWADSAQYKAAPMKAGASGPRVELLSATPDPLGAMAAFGRMYKGHPTYSLDEISDEERVSYWMDALSSHLRAPLEAVDLHFFIEGVDRSFTHQMVRQRTAVYAQESLRFAVKEELSSEVPLPVSIKAGTDEAAVWMAAVDAAAEAYNVLVNRGVPAEEARGLMPHAVLTRLNYKTNLRGLAEHAGNRLCTQAQFHWRLVVAGMVKAIREYNPPVYCSDEYRQTGLGEVGLAQGWQFEMIADSLLFRPVCYAQGKCPFMGSWDRGCSIRERVDRGAFDEIAVEEWLMDPAAART